LGRSICICACDTIEIMQMLIKVKRNERKFFICHTIAGYQDSFQVPVFSFQFLLPLQKRLTVRKIFPTRYCKNYLTTIGDSSVREFITLRMPLILLGFVSFFSNARALVHSGTSVAFTYVGQRDTRWLTPLTVSSGYQGEVGNHSYWRCCQSHDAAPFILSLITYNQP
jgi:hypothetical protein